MLFRESLAGLILAVAGFAQAYVHGGHAARQTSGDSSPYEYVIVGSGPGGAPLAARLAIAGHKVLLLDAGGDNSDNVNVTCPAYNLEAAEDEALKWDFWVSHYEDQERQALDSKMTYRKVDGSYHIGQDPPLGAEPLGILYPRSGALGGCGDHNTMITILPHESDWTYVQDLTGDDSWAPDNMRTYFEKLELAQYTGWESGHGHDGWLRTSLTPLTLVLEDLKVISIVLSAASAMGKGLLSTVVTTVTGLAHILLDDFNSDSPFRDQTTDMYQVPLAKDNTNSTRSSPRDFVLEVARAVNDDGSRKYNLDIQLHTLATKIRFDQSGTTPKAIGVEYLEGQHLYSADPRYSSGSTGTPGYVAASKEVVVSGGTFNTPQLLKLSGVGPREELESFGIDVVKDLPGVGTNMMDRYEISVVGQTPDRFTLLNGCNFGHDGQTDPCLEQWQQADTIIGKGTYTTSGAALGITRKSSAAAEADDPDTFVLGAPAIFAGYKPGFAYDAVIDGNIWSWVTLKAHTRNHAGTVKLRSASPRDTPVIAFNSFDTGNTADGADEKDLQALYEGVLYAREAFDKLIPLDGDFEEIKPGRNVSTEADVKQWIKNEAWGHHACCSASIGSDDDENAVLDSSFRVRGVDGLRVVDASVFPKIPGYFISLPIYMVSEKAADVIISGN